MLTAIFTSPWGNIKAHGSHSGWGEALIHITDREAEITRLFSQSHPNLPSAVPKPEVTLLPA